MTSHFIISEMGECKEYSTLEQLSKLYLAYLSQIGISSEDTYLVTSKGEKISSEELISNQSLNVNLNETIFAYSQLNHYELFQQVLINDIISKRYSINFTSANLLSSGELNKKSLNAIEMIIKDLASSQEMYDSVISHKSIEATYHLIVNTYSSYNNISLTVSSSLSQIKKMKENIAYMQKAKKQLVTHFNSIIPQLSAFKVSMESKEAEISRRIKQSDQAYRNYLEVKCKEQTERSSLSYKHKGAIDENKLVTTKATIIKKHLLIQSKIKEKNQLLMQLIDRITKENITSEAKSNHKDIELINKAYEQLCSEKAKYKKHKLYDDLMLFQGKCQTALNEIKGGNKQLSPTQKSILCFNDIKAMKARYEGLFPLPPVLHQTEDKANQFKEILKRMIMTNCQFIFDILESIKVLLTLQGKYKSYEQFLILIEADVNEFDLLTQGAIQYNEYRDEINSRLQFNQSINQSIRDLQCLIAEENDRRRQFNTKNGEAMEKVFHFINNTQSPKKNSREGGDELKLSVDFVHDSHLYYPHFSFERQFSIEKRNEAPDKPDELLTTQRILREKESQLKQMAAKLRKKEEQILSYHNEVDKIGKAIEALSNGLLAQVKDLNEEIKEKDKLMANLGKVINENTFGSFAACPMCKDVALNSVDYQMWAGFVKELNAKLTKKAEDCSNLQMKYNESINHLFVIKKTFFNHLNHVLSKKNEELFSEREYYENVILHLEDLLSFQFNRESNSDRERNEVKCK